MFDRLITRCLMVDRSRVCKIIPLLIMGLYGGCEEPVLADWEAPAITILSPTNGAAYAFSESELPADIPIRAEVTDNDALASVICRVANDSILELEGMDPYTWTWAIGLGDYGGPISVEARDSAGNTRMKTIWINVSIQSVDTIAFDIPGPGPHTIKPTIALPTIYDPVVIDGTTDPNFAGTPMIELDGTQAGNANGLWITAGNSTVRGSVINNFSTEGGIQIALLGGNIIEHNYIGSDLAGAGSKGNLFGVWLTNGSSSNTIGADDISLGNLISGNLDIGVQIQEGAESNVVKGNLIGVDYSGLVALGNGGHGIVIENVSNNIIGGFQTAERNVISGNGLNGIMIEGATAVGNSILSNAIYANTGMGIDIAPAGNNPNDSGDADTGANDRQNFPDITSVAIDGNGDLIIEYRVDSDTSNSAYPLTVQFFISDGAGEGKILLGDDTFTTADFVNEGKSLNLGSAATLGYTVSDGIVATATDANGNTSEFSQE